MPTARPTVVLLRHGETAWSRDGKHTGRTDVPLTELGREQAVAAAAKLPVRDPALVLVSPLARARDTAALAGLHGAEVDDDLREWDYGDYEGRTTVEIRAEAPGWDVWSSGCPGGEDAEAVGVRADRVVARCLGAGGDVVLVAHGHLLRVLAARWLGQPAALGRHLPLATAAVCVLGWEHEWPGLDRWNV